MNVKPDRNDEAAAYCLQEFRSAWKGPNCERLRIHEKENTHHFHSHLLKRLRKYAIQDIPYRGTEMFECKLNKLVAVKLKVKQLLFIEKKTNGKMENS